MITAETNNLQGSSKRPNWKKCYILANHWKSDLEFYREELRHLHHIINSYSIWIVKEDNQHLLETMERKLYQTRTMCEELIHRVSTHVMDLGRYVEKDTLKASARLTDIHTALGKDITAFVHSYRNCRKEIFSNTETILDTEKDVAIISRD
ncbi:hypothetical protein PP178_10190 [Zeaxanthinibacter sp. PT1]|uniref:hypothetical protein n=1 Tax=Zeaxanthinibacter TaxID=561554 RepID=UPI00234AFB06|nr:hypothetical protein [Zeaxanthinibacter sp. PT1]MDC6351923.1 hypothetical protein [Zeaxanthinibacter sp. PT1]